MNGKRWGEAMGHFHRECSRSKDIEAAENWQHLHEPQQLWILEQQITARGKAGERTAQRHKSLHFQAQRRESVGNGNVSVEEATGLEDSEGYSWEPGLRKSFQAGEKYGGGRVGEKYLEKHLTWQEGRGVHHSLTTKNQQSPCTESYPAEEWLVPSRSPF